MESYGIYTFSIPLLVQAPPDLSCFINVMLKASNYLVTAIEALFRNEG